MRLTFDTQGNEKQKEVCSYWNNDEVTDIVYGGSKGSGKSFLGVNLIFGDSFIYPGIHCFIARKKLNDLRKFTIPSIHEVFEIWGLGKGYYKYNGQDNLFELYNGSRVYLIEAKYMPSDPLYQRFGSMQMTRGWIEEAGEFEDEAVRNLAASIGRWKNDKYNLTRKLLQTCNPAKNYLYRDYYKKSKQGKLENWKRFVQALPEDNKCLPPGYIEQLRRSLSKNGVERLLKGNWEYDDDPNALIEFEAIGDLYHNSHVPAGQPAMTCDIALRGSDAFKIYVWSGWRVVAIYTFPKCDGKEVVDKINQIKIRHGVPNSRIVFDADGVGGFIGGVNGFIPGAKEFHNGASPIEDKEIVTSDGDKKPNYENLKTQCCFRIAKRINNRLIWIQCYVAPEHKDRISSELEQVKERDADKDGKLKIKTKKEIIQDLGHSPDDFDALMMREYLELSSETPFPDIF